MSYECWQKKYYPTKPHKSMTALQAVLHSLQKWIGLRPANLERHGMRKMSDFIGDEHDDILFIDHDSCSLCVKYLDEDSADPCRKCPLYRARGGVECEDEKPHESMSPYWQWQETGDPEPMIRDLRKAKKMILAEMKLKQGTEA